MRNTTPQEKSAEEYRNAEPAKIPRLLRKHLEQKLKRFDSYIGFMARSYAKRRAEYDDLRQEANFAIWRSLLKDTYNDKPDTYYKSAIRNSMLNYSKRRLHRPNVRGADGTLERYEQQSGWSTLTNSMISIT